jgi:hypothetical protein
MPFVRTRISVSGFTAAEVRAGLKELRGEFRERPWIIHAIASWDESRRRLVITTYYEGADAEGGGQAASDEVWDCVIACINFSSAGICFEVEEAVTVEKAEPGAAADRGNGDGLPGH